MVTNSPDPRPTTDAHLTEIRNHLLHIRRSLGMLVLLAAGGLLLAMVLALNTID